MTKVISWKMSEPKTHAKDVAVCKSAEYKWRVERFPTVETKSVRASYGDVKVVKRNGK